MFEKCNELKYIDLSNFNINNVTNMGNMFSECRKSKEIKGIKKFNNIKLTNMENMFEKCNE